MDELGQTTTVHLVGIGIDISSSFGGSKKETELFLPVALPDRRDDPIAPEGTVAPNAKGSLGKS